MMERASCVTIPDEGFSYLAETRQSVAIPGLKVTELSPPDGLSEYAAHMQHRRQGRRFDALPHSSKGWSLGSPPRPRRTISTPARRLGTQGNPSAAPITCLVHETLFHSFTKEP